MLYSKNTTMYFKLFKCTKSLVCTEMSTTYTQVRFRPPLSSWGASVRSKHLPSRHAYWRQPRWVPKRKTRKHGSPDQTNGNVWNLVNYEHNMINMTQYITIPRISGSRCGHREWASWACIVSLYTWADLLLSTRNVLISITWTSYKHHINIIHCNIHHTVTRTYTIKIHLFCHLHGPMPTRMCWNVVLLQNNISVSIS